MCFYKLKTQVINLESDSDTIPCMQKDVTKEMKLYINLNTFDRWKKYRINQERSVLAEPMLKKFYIDFRISPIFLLYFPDFHRNRFQF